MSSDSVSGISSSPLLISNIPYNIKHLICLLLCASAHPDSIITAIWKQKFSDKGDNVLLNSWKETLCSLFIMIRSMETLLNWYITSSSIASVIENLRIRKQRKVFKIFVVSVYFLIILPLCLQASKMTYFVRLVHETKTTWALFFCFFKWVRTDPDNSTAADMES